MNIAALANILEADQKRNTERAIQDQKEGHWANAQHHLGQATEARKILDLIRGGWI